MIRTDELMIGDWVYMEANRGYEAQYIQVETIPDASSKDHYGHIGAFPVGGDNDFRDIEDKHLFPIPLTAEILEKNGLNPDTVEDAYKYCYKKDDVSIVECYANAGGRYRGIFSFGDTRLRITLRFVHELQHALRLCGIEKEIEL